ncbi:TPA: DUF1269 domain-containing protein, partial [Enterococcus faecium]|nr:DUF1269 domain-containing protein [Enterococcus faecium]
NHAKEAAQKTWKDKHPQTSNDNESSGSSN